MRLTIACLAIALSCSASLCGADAAPGPAPAGTSDAAATEARLLLQLEIKALAVAGKPGDWVKIQNLVASRASACMATDLQTLAYIGTAFMSPYDYDAPYFLWFVKRHMMQQNVLTSQVEQAQMVYLAITKKDEVKPALLDMLIANKAWIERDVAAAQAAAAAATESASQAAAQADRAAQLDRDIAWDADKLREAEGRDRRAGLTTDSINTANLRSSLQDKRQQRSQITTTKPGVARRVSTGGVWYDDALIAYAPKKIAWLQGMIETEQKRLAAVAAASAPATAP